MALRFNKGFNINRLIKRILTLIIGLLVGGLVLSAFIDAFRGYCSVLFAGLGILGVNLTAPVGNQTWTGMQAGCLAADYGVAGVLSGHPYTIGATGNLNSGILTVVGVIGVAGIIMTEFVRW